MSWKNKENQRAYQKRWIAENKEHCQQYLKDYRKRFPEKLKAKQKREIITRHGITIFDYEFMLSQCDGQCPICNTPWGTDYSSRPNIDHDHDTGKVRGILCTNCNKAEGYLKTHYVA